MFGPILQNEVPGLIVVFVFVFLSLAALLSVAGRMSWLVISTIFFADADTPKPRAYIFFSSQLGYYAACLLIANFFNAVAGVMGLPWLIQRGITEGSFCTSQATLMQFGNVSNGYFVSAIAVHTFNSLVLRRRQSGLICLAFIAVGWLVSAAMAIAPELALRPAGNSLYGISGLSCGVKDTFPALAFFFHLLPIFAASLVSAILYSLIFLSLRGTLRIRGGIKLTLDPESRWHGRGKDYQQFVGALSQVIIWFPVAYIVLLVPYSVTRLLWSSGRFVPFQAKIMAYIFWFLLGVVNVVILYKTFCVLGPAIDVTSQKDLESFAATKELRASMTGPIGPIGNPVLLQEKIAQYRYGAGPSPTLRPLVLSRDRTDSMASHDSNSSSRGLLSGRSESPIAYPTVRSPASAMISAAAHARQFSAGSPAGHFRNGSLDSNPGHRRAPSSPRLNSPTRQDSIGSYRGLPAPSRTTRTPSPQGYHTMARVGPPVRNSSLPQDIPQDELDIASWLERHTQDSRQRQPVTGLRLSAVSEFADIPPAPATASTMYHPETPSGTVAPPVPVIEAPPKKRNPARTG